MSPTISIVIPCLNEQDGLQALIDRLSAELVGRYSFEVIIVDDGSTDHTLERLKGLAQAHPFVRYISLSRNFGHQQALKAGMDSAKGECVITMDADLQHPPVLIHTLIQRWKEGHDIVYTVRKHSKDLPWFKRATSSLFYRVINTLIDFPLEEGSADFRLIDRRVVTIIADLQDPFLFLRGLIPWLGFRQARVEYEPDRRFTGTTKYSLVKMLRLALHGVTSFSVRPLRLAMLFGMCISGLAFLYGIYELVRYFILEGVVRGWASVLTSVLFLGGMQLVVLGIIGEYLGKLYVQAKHRPDYIVRERSD
jgi:glycosyltransferase involved in cell wall biosynthesis